MPRLAKQICRPTLRGGKQGWTTKDYHRIMTGVRSMIRVIKKPFAFVNQKGKNCYRVAQVFCQLNCCLLLLLAMSAGRRVWEEEIVCNMMCITCFSLNGNVLVLLPAGAFKSHEETFCSVAVNRRIHKNMIMIPSRCLLWWQWLLLKSQL